MNSAFKSGKNILEAVTIVKNEDRQLNIVNDVIDTNAQN